MPVVVAHFRTRIEAEFAHDLLEDAGIPSVVSSDDAGGMYPGRDGARLLVDEADAEDARDILLDAGAIKG